MIILHCIKCEREFEPERQPYGDPYRAMHEFICDECREKMRMQRLER